MSNIIEIGGGGSSSAVLIPKVINANGVYSASSDSADGYDEVTVSVPTAIESVIPLVSTERFAQTSSYGGTDVSKAVQTFTISEDGVLRFGANSYAVTNTSGNDGYVDIRINGSSIAKKYLPSGTNTSFSVPDTSVSANDVLTICVGFDNTHSNCWFNVFTAVTLIGVEAPIETWIINSKSATNIPTTTAHFVYNNGLLTGYDVADNAGNETVTMGDISTYIGNSSGFYWWVTANANMTYRLYDVINGTLGSLQTVTAGNRIISDGTIDDPYCIEIRRYS